MRNNAGTICTDKRLAQRLRLPALRRLDSRGYMKAKTRLRRTGLAPRTSNTSRLRCPREIREACHQLFPWVQFIHPSNLSVFSLGTHHKVRAANIMQRYVVEFTYRLCNRSNYVNYQTCL